MRLGTALVFCCSVIAWAGVQGCSVLLDTKSLTDGDSPAGGGGEVLGGSTAGGAVSGSSIGGSPNTSGSVSGGAGSTGVGATGGGTGGTGIIIVAVGGDPAGGATTTCSSDAVELCDGLDNDCDPSTPDVCPRNCVGVARGDGGYMMCTSEIGFAEAEVVCEGSQMKLVKIDDASENSFVRSLVKVTIPYVWIGASDPSGGDVYQWIDGSVLYDNGSAPRGVYEDFLAGQPEHLAKRTCVQMEAHTGGWSTTACTDTQPFVCESY